MVSRYCHTNKHGKIILRREKDGNERRLTLIGADDDHPMAAILDEHKEVQINYEMFKQGTDEPAIGDLHDIREARKSFAKYMRDFVLRECGYKGLGKEERSSSRK